MGATGRGVRCKKQTVEDVRELSIFTLYDGILTGRALSWIISWTNRSGETIASLRLNTLTPPGKPRGFRITYTITQGAHAGTSVDYVAEVTTTPCYFGGLRRWFTCPGEGCRRRVAKLYMPPGARYYLCRHCHQLTYEGRQRHRDRAYDDVVRYWKYQRRLEASRTGRQSLTWTIRLLEARPRLEAHLKDLKARWTRRLMRGLSSRQGRTAQRYPHGDMGVQGDVGEGLPGNA